MILKFQMTESVVKFQFISVISDWGNDFWVRSIEHMPAGCCNIDQCEELTNASSGRRVTSSMKLSITSSVIRFHQSIVFSKILKILTAAVNLFQNSRVTIFPEKCLWNSLKHQHNAFLQIFSRCFTTCWCVTNIYERDVEGTEEHSAQTHVLQTDTSSKSNAAWKAGLKNYRSKGTSVQKYFD